ncbi:hypothetical protein ACHWQZ_G013978 [Mnemiopsis leidyi]
MCLNYSVAQCTSLKYLSYQFMEQTFKTDKSDHLPLELWYKIFHYIRVEDTLQLSLVCKNFKELINKNALWRWYCLKKCSSLTLKQVNSFPSCKEFYREILKPFSFAVGHSFMFPGVGGAGRMCKVRLQDRALVITPNGPALNNQKQQIGGQRRFPASSCCCLCT